MLPIDFLDLVGVEDPQIAPDASNVMFVRTRFNLEDNRVERALWRIRPGAYASQFTQGVADRAPRWSSSGRRVAFLRTDAEKKTSVYAIPADGGEPVAIAGPFDRVTPAVWSPDEMSLAFSASVRVEPAETTLAFDEQSGARHIIALPYKSDASGLFDGTRMQLHIVPPDGFVRVIPGGAFEAGAPVWSPDGRHLAFVANPEAPEGAFVNDLYAVGTRDDVMVRITSMNGIIGSPVYSRDGTEIAFIGTETDDFSGGRPPQLWCVAAEGGTPRRVSAQGDHFIGNAIGSDLRVHDTSQPYWMPGDGEIVVQRSHEGACQLVAFARDGSSMRELVEGERVAYAFSGAADGTLAFALTDPVEPGDLFLLGSGGERKLTEVNLPWLDLHSPVAPERIRPKAADGTILDAWIVDAIEPPHVPPPLVHAIHGGPHAAYGFAFSFEFQMLASLGMSVVYGNPRGSQSYGEAYARAISGDWGGIDASDLLAIKDAALEVREIDRRHVAVQGGSYGGLMTTWLLGHGGGYACGVSMRAVNDYVSFAGVTDIPRFIERETGADWSDGGSRLFELSPIRAAAAIEAPLLIMHSERDLRCPIDQAEQLFTRLRLLGKTAEFVRFSSDNHDLSRAGNPCNRVLRYRSIAHWLLHYLGVKRRLKRAPGWLFEALAGEDIPPDERLGEGIRSMGLLADARKL